MATTGQFKTMITIIILLFCIWKYLFSVPSVFSSFLLFFLELDIIEDKVFALNGSTNLNQGWIKSKMN